MCDEKTNTREGTKDKRVRTTSDDVGAKSVSEKFKSEGGKSVGENFTGGKSGVIRKDKWTKNNNCIYFLCLTHRCIRSTVTTNETTVIPTVSTSLQMGTELTSTGSRTSSVFKGVGK